jgi:hypothetical protein
MFLNKWLVIDSLQKLDSLESAQGISFLLNGKPDDLSLLLRSFQENLWNIPFTIVFPEGFTLEQDDLESMADNMIRFFFQPSYYTYDFRPVVFVGKINLQMAGLLELVNQKCRNQAMKEMKVYELQPAGFGLASWINSADIDLSNLTKQWRKHYFEAREPSEIHIVIAPSSSQKNIIRDLAEAENRLLNTSEYSEAIFLYNKQQEIEECRHQLYMKSVSEKNTELYLSIQKEERTRGLNWYYHEYEILPLWYKKFGHLLKVIMGKRSFKSLFNDKVKKHKD